MHDHHLSMTQPPQNPPPYVPGPSTPAYPLAQPPPVPSSAPKKSGIPLVIGIVAGAVLFFCGLGAGFVAGQDTDPSTPAAATTTAAAVETTAARPPATAAVTTAPPPGPKTSFADGIWEVNVDIAPGRYKTVVPASSSNCYWERQRDDTGGLNSILANDNHDPGESVTVTIAKTDFGFKSSGCGTWAKTA
jgi:hypothetical protein